ncbi:hypothetical protein BGX28_004516 [Mortierella sp. GBA30]|nr:hypothetical protein BGX28_004516 [Mortierella sp. GBA30]
MIFKYLAPVLAAVAIGVAADPLRMTAEYPVTTVKGKNMFMTKYYNLKAVNGKVCWKNPETSGSTYLTRDDECETNGARVRLCSNIRCTWEEIVAEGYTFWLYSDFNGKQDEFACQASNSGVITLSNQYCNPMFVGSSLYALRAIGNDHAFSLENHIYGVQKSTIADRAWPIYFEEA